MQSQAWQCERRAASARESKVLGFDRAQDARKSGAANGAYVAESFTLVWGELSNRVRDVL